MVKLIFPNYIYFSIDENCYRLIIVIDLLLFQIEKCSITKKSLTCIHLERLDQDKVYFCDLLKSNVPQHSKQKKFKRFRNWKLAFSSVTKYQLIVCFGSRQPNNSIINRSPKIIGISVLKHSKTNKVQ